VIDTTLNLPTIHGGKKLIYTHKKMPLIPLSAFSKKGKTDPLFDGLAKIISKTKGLWSVEAEEFFLINAPESDDLMIRSPTGSLC